MFLNQPQTKRLSLIDILGLPVPFCQHPEAILMSLKERFDLQV